MPDYELERLNSRSFEQLMQALCIQILGPDTIVYGDGPDGGREVAFGPLYSYPDSKNNWIGKGVAQSKFKQIPHAKAHENTKWLINQLRQEFEKYPKLTTNRIARKKGRTRKECPQYYILVTNIRLSSSADSGGKDRVSNQLKSYMTSHGLKGFQIWDGDHISRLLDSHSAIRRTYSAWLMPGDVLSDIVDALQLSEPSFLPTIERYIEAEFLDDQFARLSQGGYTDAQSIPLSSVFVDLPVDLFVGASDTLDSIDKDTGSARQVDQQTERQSERHFVRTLFEEGRQLLRPSANQDKIYRPGKHNEPYGRAVLVGGPGQGKTTVGQFACQLLRAELISQSKSPKSPEVIQAITRFTAIVADDTWVPVRRYPLRVDLKSLEAISKIVDESKAMNNERLTMEERRVLISSPCMSSFDIQYDGLHGRPVGSGQEPALTYSGED